MPGTCNAAGCTRGSTIGGFCAEHYGFAKKKEEATGGNGASHVSGGEPPEKEQGATPAAEEEKKCPGCGAKLTKKGKCRSCSAKNRKKPKAKTEKTAGPVEDRPERRDIFLNLIAEECDGLKEMLLAKNRKYGNSALDPKRVFSKADAEEQLLVRIDDKISRVGQGEGDDEEDAILDLAGYLVLLKIARRQRHAG